MATETADEAPDADVEEGWDDHLRGLTVTTLASLFGIGAGVAATAMTEGPGERMGLYLLFAAILVQFPIYMLVGMDVEDFGLKQYLYVGFMTFSMWFVSWAILLTAGTAL